MSRILLLIFSSLALTWLLSSGVNAEPANGQQSSSALTEAFNTSARHWGVPVEILMAIGYVESHWEQRNGEPSIDNGYGGMHLVDGPMGTLRQSQSFTGLSAQAIKSSELANIEAGAAILNDISHKLGMDKQDQNSLVAWYPAVAEYSGSSDPSVSDGYAREV